MQSLVYEIHNNKWCWRALWVAEGELAISFWLCGNSAHPWHLQRGATRPHGKEVVLPAAVSELFCNFLRDGDPVVLSQGIHTSMNELRTLLGTATALP